jgi:hypothetical protein
MNSYDYLMDLRKRAAQIIDDAWRDCDTRIRVAEEELAALRVLHRELQAECPKHYP